MRRPTECCPFSFCLCSLSCPPPSLFRLLSSRPPNLIPFHPRLKKIQEKKKIARDKKEAALKAKGDALIEDPETAESILNDEQDEDILF